MLLTWILVSERREASQSGKGIGLVLYRGHWNRQSNAILGISIIELVTCFSKVADCNNGECSQCMILCCQPRIHKGRYYGRVLGEDSARQNLVEKLGMAELVKVTLCRHPLVLYLLCDVKHSFFSISFSDVLTYMQLRIIQYSCWKKY